MIPFLSTPVMYGLAAVAVVGLAGAGVQTVRLSFAQSSLAKEKQQGAEIARVSAEAYAEELRRRDTEYVAVQKKATELGQGIAETEAHLMITQMERDDAIKRATRGSACLNARTVGMLNAGSATAPVPAMPTPASGQPDARADAGGTAAPGASDTDVALYISDARTRYSSCAKRLSAWQDWYAALPQGAD